MLLSRMGLVLVLIRNLVSNDSSEMFFKREGVPQFLVRYPMHLELELPSLTVALRLERDISSLLETTQI